MKKEDFINTKWDAREWTEEQKAQWQKRMFDFGLVWKSGDTNILYLDKCYYFIDQSGFITCDDLYDEYAIRPEEPASYEDAFPSPTQHLEQQRAKARFDASIDATLAERGSRYGEFEDGAAIMQSLKGVMKSTDGWARLSPPQREALEMIQHKIGRILNGDPNYADSWVDIAGYAKLISDNLEDK